MVVTLLEWITAIIRTLNERCRGVLIGRMLILLRVIEVWRMGKSTITHSS
jgi:hypothetical protein